MRRDAKLTTSRAPRTLSSAELEHVCGGTWESPDGGGGGSSPDYSWEGIPHAAPTIPDLGWDSYFYFA